MGDPSAEEIQRFSTVADVAAHAQLEGDVNDRTTALGSLFDCLGLKRETLPAIIGVISETDFNTALGQWQIATAVTEGTVTARRGPNVAEQGKARFFARICRLKLGADHSSGSTPTPSQGGTLPSTAARKVKLSQVLSQLDDTEVDLLPEADIITMYGRYEVLFGKGQRPPNNREPTSEQLTALKSLLDTNQTPFVDFAIWGPFGSRIRKKLKFQGLTLNKEGDLVQTEVYGPPNLLAWKASYQVFSNCMIMLDAADLGALLQYQERVERMHERYGERTWALLYQAEVRCRLEEWPRVRMELKRAHSSAVSGGGTTAYEAARPWNEALRQIAERDRFWTDEFTEPALVIMANRGAAKQLVSDDARTSHASSSVHGPQMRDLAGGPTPSADRMPPIPPRPRNANRTGRFHELIDGRYQVNRTGFGLCAEYQEGKCNDTINGTWCARNPDLAHQCARCLGSHSMERCPHERPPSVGLGTGRKGKGKGRGKGKKGHRSAPF